MSSSWRSKQSSSRVHPSIILFFIALVFFLHLTTNKGFAQTADFTVDIATGCFPLTVKFTNTSTGTTLTSTYSWDFGNGKSSSLEHPGTIYDNAGTYTVSLTVFSGAQNDSEVKTGYIIVHGFPEPAFSPNKTSDCAPLGVTFTDQTNDDAGAITERLWVFGDGGTSSSVNPLYVYEHPGDMYVSLKVKNEHGCERTKIIASPIHVLGPVTDFSVDKTFSCELASVFKFTDESTGTEPLSHSWKFGDGSTSTEINPPHSYSQAGAYTVTETVTDSKGCISSHSINVNAGFQDGLDFQPLADQLCPMDELRFSIQANSPITSYDWNFGNGTFSTESNPPVRYPSPGNYTITLTAKLQNNICLSRVTRTVKVLEQPNTSYSFTVDCDYNVVFKNTSSGFEKVEWYIDNTLTSSLASFEYPFKFPGSHIVTLIAYNNSGCQKTFEQLINLPSAPTASFLPDQQQDCLNPSLSGCAPFSLQFTNTSTSSSTFKSAWSFGDGASSTEKSPLHVFGKGTFVVTLTIQTAEGCTSNSSTLVVVADTAPVAEFDIDKASVCSRVEEITFTAQPGGANFWCWDFGDGSGGTGSEVKHAYNRPGTYTVTLTSKNAGCASTKSKVVEVKNPFVDFNISKSCSTPFTIGLQNLSEKYDRLNWDFGDGYTYDKDTTSYTYAALGSYDIKLTAFNAATGCETFITLPVLIQEINADFEIDNPTACKNAPVKFTDKSASAVQWAWSFGDNTTSDNQNPSTAYQSAGLYDVTLTTINSDGCSDHTTQQVKVLGLEANFDFTATSNCDDFVVNFTDHSEGFPAITDWIWDFGDGFTSLKINPPHTYQEPNTYTVKLTLKNSEGECSFIKEGAVVFDLPIPDLISSSPVTCIDKPVSLISASLRAERIRWDLGNGETSTQTSVEVAYPAFGKYDVTLSAVDKYGCKQSITKPAFITVSKPTANFDVQETDAICPPFTSFFNNKSVGTGLSWQWDFGDGKSSSLSNPANTFLKPGDYDVTLKVTDEFGCTDEVTTKNLIHVGGPSGHFTSNTTGNSCTGKTVVFTANTINTVTHQWDFGDGNVTDVVDSLASHSYSEKGIFIIDLVMIDGNGCKLAADQNMKITVSDTSIIKIKKLPDCFFGGDEFTLSAEAEEEKEDNLSWTWQVNGSPVGTDAELQTIIDESGKYELTLSGTNSNGCTSRIPYLISVQDHLRFIPNVITPNNDGLNDTFEIEKITNGEWNLSLYNRWGTPVHTEPGYQGNWNGGNLDTGVYYFSVQNAQCGEENYKGPVSIIR